MNNPFIGDLKDDDLGSEGDDAQAQNLMQAGLEISPLVTSVPPMPGDATSAPSLPRSTKEAAHLLVPKKQKLNDGSAIQFSGLVAPAEAIAAGTASVPLAASSLPQVQSTVIGVPSDAAHSVAQRTAASGTKRPIGVLAESSKSAEDKGAALTANGHGSARLVETSSSPQVAAYPVSESVTSAAVSSSGKVISASATKTPIAGLTASSTSAEGSSTVLAPNGDSSAKAKPTAESSSEKTTADASMLVASNTGPSSVEPAEAIAGNADKSDIKQQVRSTSPSPSDVERVKREQRMSIMAIVTGAKAAPTKILPADKGAETTPKEQPSEPDKKRVRKKAPKPLRRILVARKEYGIAKKFLHGKIDLLDCLPREDCVFLGESAWIFTADHLRSVLDPSSVEESKEKGITVEKAVALRREVIEALGRKYQREAADSLAKKEEDTKEKTSPPVQEKNEKPGVDSPAAKNSGTRESDSAGKSPNPFFAPAFSTGSPPLNLQITIPPPPGAEKDCTAELKVPKHSWTEEVFPLESLVDEFDEDDTPVQEKYLKIAEEKVDSWKAVLDRAIHENVSMPPQEKRFPLEGPVSVLFSKVTQNFLKSADISTTFEFLALRRTETGAICDMFRVWREKCCMEGLGLLPLAKHLLGITFRVESALSSVLSIDKKTRRWMNDSIVIMTGAAREFLVDYLGILTLKRFLNTRTKDLSQKLAEWREGKGLVPLKGSGKVAMVSGWKAGAREERQVVEAEGKVISDIDLKALSALDIPIVFSEIENKTALKLRPVSGSHRKKAAKPKPKPVQVDYAAHSPLFVEHVLGKNASGLLSKIGIHTSSELDEAEVGAESVLYKALIEAGTAIDLPSCNQVVSQWRTDLKKKLKDMSKGDMLKKNRAPDAIKSPPQASSSRTPRHLTFQDPYDTLSAASKQFLRSIGITTGEKFLSTRTTDISAEFVLWREREGKAELKGLGAIASVSGWKASCRKAAVDMGLHHIATLEPDSVKTPGGSPPVRKSRPKSRATTFLSNSPAPNLAFHDSSLEDDLAGRSRVEFSVQGSHIFEQSPSGQFIFELTIRRPKADSQAGIYATYKGSSQIPTPCGSRELEKPGVSPCRIEVLEDVPVAKRQMSMYGNFDFRLPFSSLYRDCGLVELGVYGALPLEAQDLDNLKEAVESFVFGREWDNTAADPPLSDDFNIIICRRADGGVCYFLHTPTPLEKGQTIQLRFPSILSLLHQEKGTSSTLRRRSGIDTALGALSQADLMNMFQWLHHDIYENHEEFKVNDAHSIAEAQRICEQRRRLSWVRQRAFPLFKAPTLSEKESNGVLTFDTKKIADACRDFPKPDVDLCLKQQVKEELTAALETDPICGTNGRSNWCKALWDLFEPSIDSLSDIVVTDDEEFCDKAKSVFDTIMRIGSEKASIKLADLLIDSPVTTVPESETLATAEDGSKGCIACHDGKGGIMFKSLEVVSQGKPQAVEDGNSLQQVSLEWYRKIIKGTVVAMFAAFESVLDEGRRVQKKCNLKFMTGLEDADITTPVSVFIPEQLRSSLTTDGVVPGSYQFFLGIVWPALRNHGWRLDAGDSPSDVVFSPPKPGHRKRTSESKKEGAKKRLRLSREVDRIGWGSVRKSTQRTVAATAPNKEKNEQKKISSTSVIETIGRHLDWIQEELNDEGTFCAERAGLISDAIRNCFDALSPFMSSEVGWNALPKSSDTPSKIYTTEALLHVLLVLPSILRQASLPLQEISDSLQIVQDLVDFITKDAVTLFDKDVLPPREKYIDESNPKTSNLSVRLRLLKHSQDTDSSPGEEKDGSNVGELTEALLASDKEGPNGERLLTDFVTVVMEQAIPCRATEIDVEKKFRRIHTGFPGLCCRHCLGAHGEGRYFFSTIESITTASTVLEKHLLKCPSLPPGIRDKVVATKITHPGQRKLMETGGQQAYFNHLWDRLRSAKIGGNGTNQMFVRQQKEPEPPKATEDDEGETIEFRSHLAMLDYVRTTPPWKNNKKIQGALSKYYSCLDYGGRIFQTPSMPAHFSPEWLLAKVVPKRFEYAKAKYLPG